MSAPTQHLTVRVPQSLRDGDGVRLDAMLTEAGAGVVRELPRIGAPEGWVDLLVEHTSAPAEVRGNVVTPDYDEIDGELSFIRWLPYTGPVGRRGAEPGPVPTAALLSLSDDELAAELARRRAEAETARG